MRPLILLCTDYFCMYSAAPEEYDEAADEDMKDAAEGESDEDEDDD